MKREPPRIKSKLEVFRGVEDALQEVEDTHLPTIYDKSVAEDITNKELEILIKERKK